MILLLWFLILWLLTLAAGLYQILAIVACLRQLRVREPRACTLPGISILKPVRGLDPNFESALESHLCVDYPEFEILVGVTSLDDPAVAAIRKYPTMRLVHSTTELRNGKAGVLADLAREARYGILAVNDSDITVAPDYLRRLAGPLSDERIGLVTCLYRATASTFPAKMEALGIATDFAPSALVASLVGVNEFGLGSTLAFRKSDLERIGGFESIGEYIADDYQIGKRISNLGKRVWLSTMVVETHLGSASWTDVWHHQVRWARTIRVSRGGGYAGLPITNATAMAVLAGVSGSYDAALVLVGLRYLMAFAAARLVLNDRPSTKLLAFIPLRDLFGLAVWAAGLRGSEVRWRDRRLRLDREGRIV